MLELGSCTWKRLLVLCTSWRKTIKNYHMYIQNPRLCTVKKVSKNRSVTMKFLQWFNSAVSNILSNYTDLIICGCRFNGTQNLETWKQIKWNWKEGKKQDWRIDRKNPGRAVRLSHLLYYLKMQRLDTRNMSNSRLNLIWIYLLIPFIFLLFFFNK